MDDVRKYFGKLEGAIPFNPMAAIGFIDGKYYLCLVNMFDMGTAIEISFEEYLKIKTIAEL